MLAALLRAVAILSVPAMRRLVAISLGLAVAVFAVLWIGMALLIGHHHWFGWHWLDWLADAFGVVAVAILSWLLFPAVVTLMMGFFLEQVAATRSRKNPIIRVTIAGNSSQLRMATATTPNASASQSSQCQPNQRWCPISSAIPSHSAAKLATATPMQIATTWRIDGTDKTVKARRKAEIIAALLRRAGPSAKRAKRRTKPV